MTTRLEHADNLLKAKRGTWLIVHEPVAGVDTINGGLVQYVEGDRLRVKAEVAGLICEDEMARTVAFSKDRLHALDWAT